MRQSYKPLCVFCNYALREGEQNNAWPIRMGQMCCDDCFDEIIYPSIMVVLSAPRTANDRMH